MSADVRSRVPGLRRLLPAAAAERIRPATGILGVRASALLVAQLVATGVTGLAMVGLLVSGWFTRYSSHAFQTADLLRDHGFFGGQVAWYQGWTGRFGATAAWLAAVEPGPWFSRVAPTLALVAWGAALWLTLPRVAVATGRRLSGVSRLLAVEAVLLATLSIAPALWFNLYKLTGSVTYVTPIALGTAAVGVALGAVHAGRAGARRMVPLAALGLLAMGFSDTYAGVQPIVVVFLACCAVSLAGRRRAAGLRSAVVAAASTAVGLAAVVLAPGNQVRRSFYPPPPHLTTAIARSVRDSRDFVGGPLAHSLPVLIALGGAFLLVGLAAPQDGQGSRRPGLTVRRAAVALVALIAVVVGSHLPAEQMTSAPPPPRSEIIPTYAVVLAVAYLAWGAGIGIRERHAAAARHRVGRGARVGLAAVTVAMVVAPAMSVAYVAGSWQAMSAYAAAKDLQWQEAASAAPGSDVVLDPVPTTGIGPLSHDPMQEVQPSASYWVNQSVAEYFGLHSVSAPRQGH